MIVNKREQWPEFERNLPLITPAFPANTPPAHHGIEATRQILATDPSIRVIGLSMDNSEKTAAAMLSAGAAAFLPKDAPAADLIAVIRNAGCRG